MTRLPDTPDTPWRHGICLWAGWATWNEEASDA